MRRHKELGRTYPDPAAILLVTNQHITVTDRTRFSRKKDRASYDQSMIYGVLDEGMLCHVSFVVGGSPVILPITDVRVDNRLIIHNEVKAPLTGQLKAYQVKLPLTAKTIQMLIVVRLFNKV